MSNVSMYPNKTTTLFQEGPCAETIAIEPCHKSGAAGEREEYFRRLDDATTIFTGQLEAIEKRCLDPYEKPEGLQAAVAQAITEMMAECENFGRNLGADRQVLKETQVRFRQKTDPIISKSYAMNRTRVWPQGSQGDYKTLELAYKSMPLSEGIGYYLDLFIMDLPLAHAVRNRIRKLEDILRNEIMQREQPSLLNIACGSSRELMGLVPEIKASRARITCIDTDNDALSFAQSRLTYTGIADQLEFRKYNALRLFDYDQALSDFGKQDVIYSVGLFDYLPSDFLVKIFTTLYRLLNERGTLILAFKDAARYNHHFFHWLVDWDGFQQRREEDFMKVIAEAGIPHSSLTEIREESGIIVFYLASAGQKAGD
jgi:SAM-dependent methyltransferase